MILSTSSKASNLPQRELASWMKDQYFFEINPHVIMLKDVAINEFFLIER